MSNRLIETEKEVLAHAKVKPPCTESSLARPIVACIESYCFFLAALARSRQNCPNGIRLAHKRPGAGPLDPELR